MISHLLGGWRASTAVTQGHRGITPDSCGVSILWGCSPGVCGCSVLLGQGWGSLGCVHRVWGKRGGAESRAGTGVNMEMPLGTGTPPAASPRNAQRGGAGRARGALSKNPLFWTLLLLWPLCWEHPACHRTIGVQTETPSPRAALLGLTALGGCWVGQRCPIPLAAAQAFKGQRVAIAVTRVLVQC